MPQQSQRPELETRYVSGLKMETRDDGTEQLVGYPIVFNQRSVRLWDFFEIVRPEAVSSTFNDSDIRALFGHDSTKVLGRESAGTLKFGVDDHGVRMELTPPNNTLGADTMESVRRGDIDGMSFAFSTMPNGDEWHEEDGEMIRELTNIEVSEFSIVTWPAYEGTDVSVRGKDVAMRSLDRWRESQATGRGQHPNVLRMKLDLEEQDRVG